MGSGNRLSSRERAEKEKAETASGTLTKALRALLNPLRLDQTDLRGLDEPRAVHVCKKPWQETERQEICFISIKQAPAKTLAKPQRGVRIGGGYHMTELRKQPQKSKNGIDVEPELVDKDTGEFIDGISSGQPYVLYAESGDRDRFAKGKVPPERMHYRGEENDNEYHFGTYNRGESRTSYGDRREKSGVLEYDTSVGPDVRDCASFRVFSSERRKNARLNGGGGCEGGTRGGGGEGGGDGRGGGGREEAPISPRSNFTKRSGEAKGAKDSPKDLPLEPVPPSFSTAEVDLEPQTAQALDALLSAMGLTRKSTVEEGPGKGSQTKVSRSKCRIADQWSVEMCYVCMDDINERIIEHVVEKEVVKEKIIEKEILVEVEKPVIVHTPGPERIVEKVIEKIVQIEVPVEVPCYIERKKPPTQTIGTQTDTVDLEWKIKEPAKEAKQDFAPQSREKNLGAIRVGGGFEVVKSVPDVFRKGALTDTEAQAVLASTKAETMQRMAGLPPQSGTSATIRSVPNASKDVCKEVYGLVRQQTPDRTKGIHRSQEVLAAEIKQGGGKAPPAPAGHVFGTFLRASQEKQRFNHDRGSRTPFRVYRSRVTAEDASDIAPVMRRSHSQPIRRPASAGPRVSWVDTSTSKEFQERGSISKEFQERGSISSRPSQALELQQLQQQIHGSMEATAISTIEVATTASYSELPLHRSSGSDWASLTK